MGKGGPTLEHVREVLYREIYRVLLWRVVPFNVVHVVVDGCVLVVFMVAYNGMEVALG
ncbi:hypothetical protein Hanom_Chr06g00499111 [Helianthus anomalus]